VIRAVNAFGWRTKPPSGEISELVRGVVCIILPFDGIAVDHRLPADHGRSADLRVGARTGR
jgi:hypothetical protein